MAEKRTSIHGQWSGRVAFILAATGSAVGLGNIWKFPYITGENGGGAFVLIYLLCIAVIGLPVMMGEILIGRRGKASPSRAFANLAEDAGVTRGWAAAGWMGILAGFLILSFYTVIAGWAVAYIFSTVTGTFTDGTGESIGAHFEEFTGSAWKLLFWSTVVMVGTTFTVARGVQKGIEQAVRFLMPGMLLILLILVGYAMSTGHFGEAVSFLFKPDFSKLTTDGALIALGHAFFTLSLASGVMIAYGAYLPDDTSIVSTSIIVALADTAVALLAGLAIFPIVYANSLEVAAGPGLVFVTLPIAFGNMPGGIIIGTLFFVMLVCAAFTSAISLIEPAVAWLIERLEISRGRAAIIAGTAIWVVSLGSVFSFNVMSDIHFMPEKTFFDTVDYITANIMLPAGGFLVAIFTAWIMSSKATREELALHDHPLFTAWQFVLRFVAPILIIIVFLNAIGVVDFSPEVAE